MRYKVEFRPYQRLFQVPLQTSHGSWKIREGIILHLTDEVGEVGWGEIAPIPWFGSETLEEASSFCRQLGGEITTEQIFSIPGTLPACQFGFESATESVAEVGDYFFQPQMLRGALPAGYTDKHRYRYSGLLSAGSRALEGWMRLSQQGYRTFKWKIGVAPIQDELTVFQQLIQVLPQESKLRLDANGGLNWEEASDWLRLCDSVVEQYGAKVEFLEQPLPVTEFNAMLDLSRRYSTLIALDESVATVKQLQAAHQDGWRGIFVIKPCIAGSPSRLRQFCQHYKIDAVFSSVFETAIGRQAALNLASELQQSDRAVGFGVNHWFAEDEETWLDKLWNIS